MLVTVAADGKHVDDGAEKPGKVVSVADETSGLLTPDVTEHAKSNIYEPEPRALPLTKVVVG